MTRLEPDVKLGLVAVDAAWAPELAAAHARAFERPWTTADLASLLDGAGALALAAVQDSRILGFGLARCISDEAEILTLAVDPDARRRGIGGALVEALAAAAAGRRAKALWLEAADDNAAAIALYKACGFEAAGRRRGYYAREDSASADALVMRRVLNTAAP